MKKKIISAAALISFAASLGSGCTAANAEDITVTYNGQKINFDAEPKIIDDRVMVPMRAVFETLGAKVKWDGDTQTITAKKKSKTIEMTIGSADMKKNDEIYSFDVSPVIEDGRTLIPVRAISELLGLEAEWDSDAKEVVIADKTDESEDDWKNNTGKIDLDSMEVEGDGVKAENGIITVSEGGDFEVTGTLEDGQIIIDTEDKVKLRLSGMSLTNTDGAAIYVKNADKAYITLTENTENYLADSETYTSEDEKACITSKDNLEIKGNGSLTITGNYNHGIDCSDSIEIGNGNITVTAKNDGIHANDTLSVSGGILNVTAQGDGLQSDEIVDITGGTVNVTTTGEVSASANGFEPFNDTGERAQMTDEERQSMRDEMKNRFERADAQETEADNSEDVTSKGIKADWLIDISGGEINVNSTDHAVHCASDISISGGDITLESQSKKGISAHGGITIDGGDITITKSTEGIESKEVITVNDGNISVTASDDGFNAGGGNEMPGGFGGGNGGDEMSGGFGGGNGGDEMSGGFGGGNGGDEMSGGFGGGQRPGTGNAERMTPPTGIGERMTAPDTGNAERMTPPTGIGEGMTAPDTGNGGQPAPQDMQNERGRMRKNNSQESSGDGTETDNGFQGGRGMMGENNNTNEIDGEHHIQINGGRIYINAQGDGIDSNGSLVIEGGEVILDGPTSSGNGSFDTAGAFMINGGEVIAVGSAGMAEAPNSYSRQNALSITLSESAQAGQKIEIKDDSGDTVISHTAAKNFRSVICSSEKIEKGGEYKIYIDGEEKETAVVSDTVTVVGGGNQNFGDFRGAGR